MLQINLREHDSVDIALKKLKRLCEKANVWTALRKKEHYEKPTTQRKRAKQAAIKRQKKKDSMSRVARRQRSLPRYYSEMRTLDQKHQDTAE